MRLLNVYLTGYRSIETVDFEAGPFTVLFGKNNAGKTNILEAMYGLFAIEDTRAIRSREDLPGMGRDIPAGALQVELEPDVAFDDAVWAAVDSTTTAPQPRRVAFTGRDDRTFVEGHYAFIPDDAVSGVPVVGGSDLHVLFLDWDFTDLHERVEAEIAAHVADLLGNGEWPWLEQMDSLQGPDGWRFPPALEDNVARLSSLATDVLPDFVDGSILAFVNEPRDWGRATKISLYYCPRIGVAVPIDTAGHGAARWIAAAVQLAIHLLADNPDLLTLRDHAPGGFSGHVLLVDEPEAHLHPSAAASVVRWCHRMVDRGFTVVVASHHEEFLRAAGADITFAHVTHDGNSTRARALPAMRTTLLRELADDIGMHPASALSLHRAILFVEGPLDEAVLDEYGGMELDAAGVMIIPIHGTRNLEGLIDGEFTTRLGIKTGVLTDNTITATMWDRPNRKRSSEEVKLVRLIKRFEDQGLPRPDLFGVPEDDLLFAFPAEAIRKYLNGPFPGWRELREECRAAENVGPSDSVDWKSYAQTRYGLPIASASGVRSVVRALDLAGVELLSIRAVLDDIIAWAKGDQNTT